MLLVKWMVGKKAEGIAGGLRGFDDLVGEIVSRASMQISFGACGNPVSELSVFTSSRDS